MKEDIIRKLYGIMGDVTHISTQNIIKEIIDYLEGHLIVPKNKIIPYLTAEEDSGIKGVIKVQGKYGITAYEYVEEELYEDDDVKKAIYNNIRLKMNNYLEKEGC